jgi:lysozyme
MTTPYCAKDIGAYEACRLHAYADPDSPLGEALRLPLAERPLGWEHLSGAPWTVGYGQTGPTVGPNTVVTQEEADDFLAQRIQTIQRQFDLAIPWWRSLNDARQDVFVNLAYNLGVHGLLEWEHFLLAVKLGHWDTARIEMVGLPGQPDKWALQVGHHRAFNLADQLASGVRVAP